MLTNNVFLISSYFDSCYTWIIINELLIINVNYLIWLISNYSISLNKFQKLKQLSLPKIKYFTILFKYSHIPSLYSLTCRPIQYFS